MSAVPSWTLQLRSNRRRPDEFLGAEAALLSIDGMVCSLCALNVLGALWELEGVYITEVHWMEGRATVAYDPARVSAEQLLAAVLDAGKGTWHYHPHLLSTMPAPAVLQG